MIRHHLKTHSQRRYAIELRAEDIVKGTGCELSKAMEAVARANGYKNLRELYRLERQEATCVLL